jgi:HSP20 family molecular chaperone IbpA
MAQRVGVGAAGGRGARLRDGLLRVTLPKTKAAADAAGEKIPIRS